MFKRIRAGRISAQEDRHGRGRPGPHPLSPIPYLLSPAQARSNPPNNGRITPLFVVCSCAVLPTSSTSLQYNRHIGPETSRAHASMLASGRPANSFRQAGFCLFNAGNVVPQLDIAHHNTTVPYLKSSTPALHSRFWRYRRHSSHLLLAIVQTELGGSLCSAPQLSYGAVSGQTRPDQIRQEEATR